jgi:hypothetical protein
VRAVAKKSVEVQAAVRYRSSSHKAEQRESEQPGDGRADRNKGECVSEVSVVLKLEERILAGTNKHIEVRKKGCHSTNNNCCA